MQSRLSIIILFFSFLTITVLAGETSVYAQTTTNAKKVEALVKEAGFKPNKVNEAILSIPFGGNSLADFNVVISTSDDIVVMFVIVAEKGSVKYTQEALLKLLELNTSLDKVKIGIDSEGDTVVRIDLNAKIINRSEVKESIDQVAGAADEVHIAIKPYLVKSAPGK